MEVSSMKRTFIYLLPLMLFIVFCSNEAIETADNQYGNALTMSEVTSISAVLESPDDFVGKNILIEGKVLEVCKMMGCWMEIEGDKAGTKLKVQAEEGVIEFPQTAIGQVAQVEGTLSVLILSIEEVIEKKKHHAEEMGEEFDPSTVTEPETTYELKVSGAVIK